MHLQFLLLPLLCLTGCTSISVKPVSSSLHLTHVCIQKNPQAEEADFLDVVREGFERHGISTEIFQDSKPSNCEYVVTYTALRSYDMVMFLSHAELKLKKDGIELASAVYHLKRGLLGFSGGLDPSKFQGTKSKMDPVIDQFLAAYERGNSEIQKATVGQQLIDLQKAKEAGAITDVEYEAQKAKLLQH